MLRSRRNKTRAAATTVAAALAMIVLLPSAGRADVVGWLQDRGGATRPGGRIWWGDAPKGQTTWRADVAIREKGFAPPVNGSSPIVDHDGTIYVGTVAGRVLASKGHYVWPSLVAFTSTGARKWALELTASGHHYKVRTAPAIRSDRSLVVVGYRKEQMPSGRWSIFGRVFLVSPSGSVARTSEEIAGAGLSAPLLVQDVAYVFSHPIYSDDLLYRFDTSFNMSRLNAAHYGVTGSCYCSYDPVFINPMFTNVVDPDIRPLLPTPTLDSLNKEIVQPSVQTTRLRLSDGVKIWQKDVTGIASGPVSGGVSYLPAGGGLEARTRYGDRVWKAGSTVTGVAKGDEHLYATDHEGNVSSYTTAGVLRWKRGAGDPGSLGSPVVLQIGYQDLVVVAGSQNSLTAFRGDGSIVWSITLDGPAKGSPAVSDSRIYVATEWSLYAIS